jgi:hypothetical protein
MRAVKEKQKTRAWWLSARIGRENDKRVKITEEDKERIKQLHKQGEPIREIARQFEGIASRRAIQFILYPERLARVKARAKEVKRWQAGNVKERHTPAIRNYRQHIREIYTEKEVNPRTGELVRSVGIDDKEL